MPGSPGWVPLDGLALDCMMVLPNRVSEIEGKQATWPVAFALDCAVFRTASYPNDPFWLVGSQVRPLCIACSPPLQFLVPPSPLTAKTGDVLFSSLVNSFFPPLPTAPCSPRRYGLPEHQPVAQQTSPQPHPIPRHACAIVHVLVVVYTVMHPLLEACDTFGFLVSILGQTEPYGCCLGSRLGTCGVPLTVTNQTTKYTPAPQFSSSQIFRHPRLQRPSQGGNNIRPSYDGIRLRWLPLTISLTIPKTPHTFPVFFFTCYF